MTQNTSKNISRWTEKHLKYSLKYRLKHVVKTLWQWLLTLGKEGELIEFSLKEFQEYVKKLQGQSFTFHWVKKQLDKLIFLRIVSIDKDFGHNTYRVQLRHPDATIPKKRQERNLHYHQVSVEKRPSNPFHSEAGYNSSSSPHNPEQSTSCTDAQPSNNVDNQPVSSQSTDLKEQQRKIRIIQLCAKFGILFNPNKPTTDELYKYAVEDITSSLELFKKRNKGGLIDNPQGWLIDCLRFEYYLDNRYTKNDFIGHMQDWITSLSQNSE